jgi:hypothetical protein
METMLESSLYSYPHLNLQKRFDFIVFAYAFYSTKLEKKEAQVLPGS